MNKLLMVAAALARLLMQSGGQQISVPIPIGNFQLGPGSSFIQLPDGETVINAGYGGTFSVDLGVTPAQLQADPNHPGYYLDGLYTLTFYDRNFAPSYPGYFTAEIDFGTQELCAPPGWGARNFAQMTFTCFSHAYLIADGVLPGGGPPQGGKNLFLRVTVNDGSANGGWAILFKNFSVHFVPVN